MTADVLARGLGQDGEGTSQPLGGDLAPGDLGIDHAVKAERGGGDNEVEADRGAPGPMTDGVHQRGVGGGSVGY